MEDLEQVAEAQAEVAFIESGVNPMVTDRDGFLKEGRKTHRTKTHLRGGRGW